ncbi:Tetratricopeptide-like helical domain superfamily [Sesbania bispinosa]|nr:Tetratricopeptide-like helical domain superfamily [Sesbania bispinosa]
MPLIDNQEHILALSGLWKIAITKPNNSEFPSLGIFRCMAKLIQKGVTHRDWLLKYQNIYIPYYSAHIIGSCTMNKAKFADKAVKSNVVQPLMKLLQGKISWVEQRVALRALGHLASHEATFEAVAEHEGEIVEAAINIASTCLQVVYEKFVGLKESERLEYHRNLLTRGYGDLELENGKAEEWASQLQCWSLYLLDCFACKERSLGLICKKQFLKDLGGMWGGLSNPKSPAGIGLLRTLCYTQKGRESIAELQEVIVNLCNVSRSSDERQHMAIDGLLQLLRDPVTRYRVIDTAAPVLADLVELRSIGGKHKVGQAIMQSLLQDYHKIKFCKLNLKSERTNRVLEELWDLKVDRVKRESLMSEEEIREKEVLASALKQEGNREFRLGEVENAVKKYTEALDLCPLKVRKERIVLHSNRAQCQLLLGDPEGAVSDTTRALCLSNMTGLHSKSLWRRSQAYDMKGLAKESLMDCLMFISNRFESRHMTKGFKIPYYAARMVNKQMNATWLFSSAKSSWHITHEEPKEFVVQNKIDALNLRKKTRRTTKGTANLGEQPFIGRRVRNRSRRKLGKASQSRKVLSENVSRNWVQKSDG